LGVVVLISAEGLEPAAFGFRDDEVRGAAVSLVVAAKVPFAEPGGAVAMVVEDVGDGLLAVRNRVFVSRDAAMRIDAGDQRAPEGTAERKPGDGVREQNAVDGKGVDVRRAGVGVVVAAQCLGAVLVAEQPQDVGPLPGGGRGLLRQGGGRKRAVEKFAAAHTAAQCIELGARATTCGSASRVRGRQSGSPARPPASATWKVPGSRLRRMAAGRRRIAWCA
jgi:hypothetical protein